jgi:hypothetical protein
MITIDKGTVESQVAAYVLRHPELPYRVVCERLHISKTALTTILKEAGVVRRPAATSAIDVDELEK